MDGLSPSDEEVSVRIAASMLGVSPLHLNELLEIEAIPHHRVGNKQRIRLIDLHEFRERRTRGSSCTRRHRGHQQHIAPALYCGRSRDRRSNRSSGGRDRASGALAVTALIVGEQRCSALLVVVRREAAATASALR
jgi:excisionase family DNA binding protein